jgi:hypothetical protein
MENRELELVGKVEMRIALAKDDKLESILKPYLPPLLLKLASEHQTVRNKVWTSATCTQLMPRLTLSRSYQYVNTSRSVWQEISKAISPG